MKILLVWPAITDFSSLDATWIPHGITQLATCVNNSGHTAEIVDGRTSGLEGAKDRITTTEAEYVGISILSAYAGYAKELIKHTRLARPELKIIIGGIHPTVCSEDFIRLAEYDWLIKGEGEVTLPKILNGEVEEGIVEGEHPDLDTLHSIDRTLIRVQEEPLPGLEKPFATVIIGRGCVYKCSFCYPAESLLFGKRVRYRPVERVIQELSHMASFMVHDDCFTANTKYVEEFCEALPGGLTWWCQGRADNVCDHIDLIKLMRDSGLRGMILGFESGDDRVLNSLDKGTTVAQNLEAAQVLKALGISVWANIMFGTPFEMPSAVINTIGMVQQMKPEFVSTTVFTPHPGSLLYDYCKDNDLMPEHDYEYFNRGRFEQKITTQDPNFLGWACSQLGGN